MSQSILAIDDSPEIHALLDVRLKAEGFTLHHALTPDDGLRMAAELRPDLILLDVEMPGASGFDVCARLKGDPATSPVPVIFLTGAADVATKARGFDLGAVDYVTKPFEPVELRARVRAALRTKRYQDLLAARAQVDALTGVWNRARFDRALAEAVAARGSRAGAPSLVMVDLDHFGQLNGTHGHPFGDRVLQCAGEALARAARPDDVACRYGGHEFAVVLPAGDAADATAAAEAIRAALAVIALALRGKAVPVTASFGVASSGDLADASPEALVRAARAALREATASGGDRVCRAR